MLIGLSVSQNIKFYKQIYCKNENDGIRKINNFIIIKTFTMLEKNV